MVLNQGDGHLALAGSSGRLHTTRWGSRPPCSDGPTKSQELRIPPCLPRRAATREEVPLLDLNLDYDAPVSCLPTCQSANNPPKYAPIKSGDYLVSRFRTVQKYGTPIAAYAPLFLETPCPTPFRTSS